MMKGVAIHITGIVQGVGFRPWVWKTATRLGLVGTVQNNFDGVRIELYGDARGFYHALENDPPPLSRIDSVATSELTDPAPADFRILESDSTGEPLQRISPDIGICADCRDELFDPADRRHRHPFINCVNCGPRFTIIEALPYDRPNTSMRAFAMCDACRAEYANPADRRHHAQPIACPRCGPRVEPEDWESVWLDSITAGKIVAVKGVGGFHLACDALNAAAVSKLRKRKGRESKPFALMVPNLDWARSVCHISRAEEELLLSRERPIVLLKSRSEFPTVENIAPGLNTLGIMLPYSPMHELMFDLFPGPVVMTSANHSSEPMIHENDAARKKLEGVADVFILHDRAIANRCEDAVCAVFGDQIRVFRPGRGVAPVSMPIEVEQHVLAFGADLKNAFALAHHGHVTLHPHIGDLAHPETEEILVRSIQRQLDCFHLKPELIVRDRHPDYFSSQLARTRAARDGIPLIETQHHHAHLVGAYSREAIGFAFDGSGYGDDGTIWGGEVLRYDAHGFERAFHLRPFALPGGEAAVKHPRRVLEAMLHQIDEASDADVIEQLERDVNCPLTSSMGRLFDAVSCLLGVCEHPTYDGEAAARLEAIADESERGDLAFEMRDHHIDWRPLLVDLLDQWRNEIPAAILSARFHNSIAEMIYCCGKRLADRHGNLPWVFAGGVFQNRLLVERITRVVGDEFELIFSAYPNDGGIAIGQAIIGAKQWASR